MKIQCNVCEAAEASVLCCADEAALCWACDEKVHAANKLASKHQRVPLTSSSSQMPRCDICQEMAGFFFCLQDRALLCRKCDVAIHSANAYVSAHQRFLLTGVKVGPELTNPGASSSILKSPSSERTSEKTSYSLSRRGTQTILTGESNPVLPTNAGGVSDFATTEVSFAGGYAAGNIPPWQMEEFLGLADLSQTYGYLDNGSSKADSSKRGDSDSSPILRSAEEELDDDDDDCLGQVPETSWAVPQIPSPPTASGLYWPKNFRNYSNASVSVPDICHSSGQNPQSCHFNERVSKRSRQF